jgi:hypothetical protein
MPCLALYIHIYLSTYLFIDLYIYRLIHLSTYVFISIYISTFIRTTLQYIARSGTVEYTGRTGGTFGCFQCNVMGKSKRETGVDHVMYPLYPTETSTPISNQQWIHTANIVDAARREKMKKGGIRYGAKAAFNLYSQTSGFQRRSPMSPLIHTGTDMCQCGDNMHG